MRTTILSVCLLAGTAMGQASRDLTVTDAAGSRSVRTLGPATPGGQADPGPRAGILWTYPDTNSITESVALGGGGGESWVGHSLNEKRMSKFATAGAGVPDFVYDLSADNPFAIGVDAAEDASLCAVLSWPTGGPITLRAFSDAGGATPLWEHAFDEAYTNSAKRAVSVNADGTRIAACVYDGATTLLTLFDGSGAELGAATITGYCTGVELDDAGERILVTAGANARLYDAATMTEVYTLATSGAGGYHRISRDGTAIAAGGFNIRAAREVAGVWQQVYSGAGSTDWFGNGVALSGDGLTLFVLSHDYGDSYQTNEHRLVDLATGDEIGRWTYTGSGALQNSAVKAEANHDGTLFACISWGDQSNTQPEVRVLDRALNLVGSIDTPGSPFEIDMSRDGRYLLVGSKAVHANTNGRGARTYAYENDTACFGDFNGDGSVNTQDVIAFLNAWAAGDSAADCNGDGSINTQDVICFLNAWAAGC